VLCGAMLEKIFKRHPIFCESERKENHDKKLPEKSMKERNLIYFSFNHEKITREEIPPLPSISRLVFPLQTFPLRKCNRIKSGNQKCFIENFSGNK
jgi:hypothetical protein